MGDKPTEITPINPEPQTQESPPPEWMLQILVNQFGLSPPQAQAYVDTVAHPSHSVAMGNVVTAAKLRAAQAVQAQQAQQASLVAERDRLLQGLPGRSEINRRDSLQAERPSRQVRQTNTDNKAIGESRDLAALAHSYGGPPIGQIEMPAQDVEGRAAPNAPEPFRQAAQSSYNNELGYLNAIRDWPKAFAEAYPDSKHPPDPMFFGDRAAHIHAFPEDMTDEEKAAYAR